MIDPGREVSPLADALARPLRDLRISVTDRCNLRCTYCMPREVFGKDFVFLPRAELLSFEEIERVARLFVQLGVHKIRLSGGEPLMRHGVEKLIEKLARLTCVDGQPVEIAMTTNGDGTGCDSPAIVTWRSCITSSSALCTLAGARLISSASSRLVKTGPSAVLNSPECGW